MQNRPTVHTCCLTCNGESYIVSCNMQKKHGNANKSSERNPARPSTTPDIEAQLRAILRDIKENENPEALNAVRKIFRSVVPLSYRSYVVAYILKHGSFQTSPASEQRSLYKRLFINSGRVHHLNAAHLKKLLCTVDGVNDQKIGKINIFRTYSFVEISEALAQKVITSLTGYKLPSGKPLSVGFAKRKVDNRK